MEPPRRLSMVTLLIEELLPMWFSCFYTFCE